MFSVEELSSILESSWFQTGKRELERDILRSRLGLELVSTRGEDQLRSLRRFTGAVLASLAKWENPRDGIARQLCLSAADIEAALALLHFDDVTSTSHRRHVLRSAVLYDVAGMPGVAATLAQKDGLAVDAKDFFSRRGKWGRLAALQADTSEPGSNPQKYPDDGEDLVNAALGDVLAAYSTTLQNPTEEPSFARSDLMVLDDVVGRFSSFLSRDECSALRRSLELRSQNATLLLAREHSSLQEYAVAIRKRSDLWLTLWVRRAPDGEVFVMVPRGKGRWNPHASYHRDGRFHHKSHNKKMIVRNEQPLTSNFRGVVDLGLYAGHFPVELGAVCDPSAFAGVVEVPTGVLGPKHGSILVDLLEPGCEPSKVSDAKIVRQAMFSDAIPWLSIRVIS